MYLETSTPRTDEQVFLDKFYLLVCTRKKSQFFLDKEPALKASRTSFQQGNLLVCTCNNEHLTRELFVYVLIHAAS